MYRTYKGLPQKLTIIGGHSAALGIVQIDIFTVADYPDYAFTSVSAGSSFGIGYAAIQSGVIEFDHTNNLLEKIRTPTFTRFTKKASFIIRYFWLLLFFSMTSSPIIVILLD